VTDRTLHKLVKSLREDARRAIRYTWVNSIGGSALMPRAMRWIVYRVAGLDIRTANIFDHCTFAGRHVHIGANTFVNRGCYFEGVGDLRIGADCQIGMGVMVLTSDHARANGRVSRQVVPKPVSIGNGCWIGARAVILPGVEIGPGSTVAAGAVVARDCVAGGVYGGVPARPLETVDG
jgi:acetyltransferase-like isoleucine patch superfamily enzyme